MFRTDFSDRLRLTPRLAWHGLRGLLDAPGSRAVFGKTEPGNPGPTLNHAMSSRRLLLGIGVAALLAISAASIARDGRSRSEASWINHTMEVSNKLKDVQLLFQRAESAVRGYLLTGDEFSAAEALRILGLRPTRPRSQTPA